MFLGFGISSLKNKCSKNHNFILFSLHI
jgi:hypothetical protein